MINQVFDGFVEHGTKSMKFGPNAKFYIIQINDQYWKELIGAEKSSIFSLAVEKMKPVAKLRVLLK